LGWASPSPTQNRTVTNFVFFGSQCVFYWSWPTKARILCLDSL
jgi:hypothetical protein